MYEKFYELSGKPFQLNPDPAFFYRSTGHKRAMAYLRYGLQQGQGFIVVTGDVGTGKTMLVKNLFKEIESGDFVAARIVSTNVKDLDLLQLLAAEFGLEYEHQSKAELLKTLEGFFRTSCEIGKRVLLVIDEAQNLPRSAIEELRMLSNFENDGLPLVQSFLLGQREFRAVLRAPGLEQLRQRVIAAYHLKPLSAPEVKSYVEHRLKQVGWSGNPSIQEDVFLGVFVATSGVPRRINTLFDRLLLNCYLNESHEISVALLESVRGEIEAEQGDLTDEGLEADAINAHLRSGADIPAGPTRPSDLPDRFSKFEQRLDRLQSMMEALTVELSKSNLPRNQILKTPIPPSNMNNGLQDQGFPKWTAAFISVMAAIVVVVVVVGVNVFIL
ncbi:MAG: general secretion pathway protein A [Gammaproteobacteria bacterium]|jgi:general secretion pathway protein A